MLVEVLEEVNDVVGEDLKRETNFKKKEKAVNFDLQTKLELSKQWAFESSTDDIVHLGGGCKELCDTLFSYKSTYFNCFVIF